MFRGRLVQAARAMLRGAGGTAARAAPAALGLAGAAGAGLVAGEGARLDEESLGHEFLLRQASTVNVNAATQLLTVTLVAIQDTSERLREALGQEICLVRQAMEWGEAGTPPHHWDKLVAVRGNLADLKHNLRTLFSYMEYAEKLATVAAEISFLSGNMAASDAICERIDHACRTCKNQKFLTHELQHESLELQKLAIIGAPQLEDLLKEAPSADTHRSANKKEGFS